MLVNRITKVENLDLNIYTASEETTNRNGGVKHISPYRENHFSFNTELFTDYTSVRDSLKVYLPLELDTEYSAGLHSEYWSDTLLTVQFTPINKAQTVTFSSDDKEGAITIEPQFQNVLYQFLHLLGWEVTICNNLYAPITVSEGRELIIPLYGFFLTVDVPKIFIGGSDAEAQFLKDVQQSTNDRGWNDKKYLTHLVPSGDRAFNGPYQLPAYVTDQDGVTRALYIEPQDLGAINGQVGLEEFADNSGVVLPFKKMFDRGSDETKTDHIANIKEHYDSSDAIFSTDSFSSLDEFYDKVEDILKNYVQPEDSELTSLDLVKQLCYEHLTGWGRVLVYGAGDNIIHYTYDRFCDVVKNLYKETNIEKQFSLPKKTIGSTVSSFGEAHTINLFCIDRNEEPDKAKKILKDLVFPISAGGIYTNYSGENEYGDYNSILIARKMFGGRCYNARPLFGKQELVFVDTDVKSAYPQAMSLQPLQLGRAEKVNYSVDSDGNIKPTKGKGKKLHSLKSCLAQYGDKLAERCFSLIVDYSEELPEDQNFLLSYAPPKDWMKVETEINPDDEENDEFYKDFLDKYQDVQVYTRTVRYLNVTEPILHWIMNCTTPKLRKFLLEKGKVVAAIYYDKDRYLPLEVFRERYLDYLENPDKYQRYDSRSGTYITQDSEGNELEKPVHWEHWTSVTLGELYVDKLVSLRNEVKDELKKHKKGSDEYLKHYSFQNLLKLFANTAYGAMSSRFFKGNVVAMNTVTAMVRLIVYVTETSCNSTNSITDGGGYDVNRVCETRDRQRHLTEMDNTCFDNPEE